MIIVIIFIFPFSSTAAGLLDTLDGNTALSQSCC